MTSANVENGSHVANVVEKCWQILQIFERLLVFVNLKLPASDAYSKWAAKWWSDALKTLRRLLHPLLAEVWSMREDSEAYFPFSIFKLLIFFC